MLDETTPHRLHRFETIAQVALLILLVFGCYFLQAGRLSIRGEESRWASVGQEMQRTGDWIVPRQQGRPFLSRPPVGSLLMALAADIRGKWDAWSVRLPTLIAVLFTTLMVYAYGRALFAPASAFIAAAAFPTMGEVLQMGRVGETDAVFTLFVAASLLAWHWLLVHHTHRGLAWTVGFGLAAVATLTKGPQAPLYFVAVTGIWLAWQRRWRELFCAPYFVGMLVYLSIVAAWIVPFWLKTDFASVKQIILGDSAFRFREMTIEKFALHALTYPLETLGCTGPWSLALVAIGFRSVRRRLFSHGSAAQFLLTALIVTYPTCWLTQGGLSRYFLPMYPCLAMLVGAVVTIEIESNAPSRIFFSAGRIVLYCASALTLFAVVASNFVNLSEPWSGLKLPFGWQFVVSASAIALFAAIATRKKNPHSLLFVAGTLAVSCGALYAGPVVQHLAYRNGLAEARIREFRNEVGPSLRLASIGPAHHLFSYHFGETIPILPVGEPWPESWQTMTHFCYWWRSDEPRMELPFPNEVVAEISMERDRYREPATIMVIVRQMSSPKPVGP